MIFPWVSRRASRHIDVLTVVACALTFLACFAASGVMFFTSAVLCTAIFVLLIGGLSATWKFWLDEEG
jgi:hypothetical protein